jgi:diacylglycerol kinase family enzyme
MARGTGRLSRRAWAVLALAALLLMVAGLLRVVVGSREGLLYLLVGTVLSMAILAATSWWAFTTRRVWKRRLNVTIAVLAVANVVLGLLGFGLWQAAGALAIVAGAVGYATAARRALAPTWTRPAASTPPAGLPAEMGTPLRPWLLVNPRSGGGKAEKVGLVAAARARGVEVHVLAAGDDPAALAREAVARGADAVGVAGGDGSLGLVAAVAVEADVPFVCVPAGTRNHFAGDLGLDRADPLAALDAFAGPERRIDVGVVGGRMFVNNVSLGVYADLVADPRYRGRKLATAHAVLPASLRGERALLQVDLGDGEEHPGALVLLVASNRYELNGVRERLDAGVLQVSALRVRTGVALASLAGRLAARGGRPLTGAGAAWTQWTTDSLRVEAPVSHLPAGIDGEAATLEPPLEFRLLPQALRVLLPNRLRPAAGRLRLQSWATVRRLLAVAGVPGAGPPGSDTLVSKG